MQKGEMLSVAIKLMVDKHHGQFDKGGTPYCCHPLKVMHYLKTDDEELQCIALLHDVVEDTPTTYDELREAGMSERVITAVRALTKVPGETLAQYKARVFAVRDAMLVKLCDLRHNTDIRRLKGIRDKDVERMVKYQQFYLEIQEKLQLNQ